MQPAQDSFGFMPHGEESEENEGTECDIKGNGDRSESHVIVVIVTCITSVDGFRC